jgi:hypothetical protein
MPTEKQKFHTKRRRCEQFLNATVIQFRSAVHGQKTNAARRAATDLAQVIDEMLVLAGDEPLTGNGLDCPDCGQFVGRDEEGLTEGEQAFLDGRGER